MASSSDNSETLLGNQEKMPLDMICDNLGNSNGNLRNLVEVDLSLMSNSDSSLTVANNSDEFTFDNIIGHLEDMLIDENFHRLQKSFLEKYWMEFDDSEENKHSYMPIFKEYTNQIEDFITSYLQKRVKNFEMDRFISQLEEKKDNLDGEVFEVLLTWSDFNTFKEMFMDYRAMKEGRALDLSDSLSVTSVLQ